MGTARSDWRVFLCWFGDAVGVSSAAGWIRVGEYQHGLSCLCDHGAGVTQDAVLVTVVMLNSFVHSRRVRVIVFVLFVITAGGVIY